nr:arylsulfatase [Allomuricauda sp.]
MKRQVILLSLFSFVALVSCKEKKTETEVERTIAKPNIIFLYVDDLGYADVSCYGAKGVETPNIDFLAKNGIKFTDAHSSAATCTPSRYSFLTGNYAFRNKAVILPGDAPLLIDTATVTLPKMLKKAGYTTGVVGKWHLGLGVGQVDWNTKISPGPNEIGFDYSFLLPATGDRVPTVFVENGYVVDLEPEDNLMVSYGARIGDRPVGYEHPELLKQKADRQHSETIINGVSRIGYMAGGQSAEWIDEDFPYVFNKKATDFITANKENPFFLFYSFHDIHVPRIPHDNFKGKSTMGPRGDAIVQVDFVVGEIVKSLEENGILENTLIIFTSDNGPVLNDGYEDQAVELIGEHHPSGPFRGGKYSIYEAGSRVPTITYWPGTIEPMESNAMMNQLDIYASLAGHLNIELSDDIIDSENHWKAWIGKSTKGRKAMLEEGFTLAYREGDWKYIRPLPEGKEIPTWMENKKEIESGLMKVPQLFNLKDDLGEQINLAESHPEKIEEFEKSLKQLIDKK